MINVPYSMPINANGEMIDSEAWRNFLNELVATFYPTSQTDVTSDHAIGQVYKNETGKPVWFSVQATSNTSAAFQAVSDTSPQPSTVVAKTYQVTSNQPVTLFFCVLKDSYYKVSWGAGTTTLVSWIRWN